MILFISTGIGGAMVLGSIIIAKGLYQGHKIHSNKGKIGESMVTFEKDGYVLIGETRWKATTSEPVKAGEKVIVDHVINEKHVAIRKIKNRKE
jgi:membrane-bound ClpP family serine protease